MAYLFVLALVMMSISIIAVRKAADFLAWVFMRVKTKIDETKKGELKEETEPL